MKILSAIVASFFAVATMHAQNPVITQQPVNTTVVLGQTATFSVSATGASSYVWFRDGQLVPGATSASYTFTPSLLDDGHTYEVGTNALTGSALSKVAWLHVTPRVDVPTVTAVESFGTAPAATVADSFGLGVDSYLDWEFAAVAAMGGKWIRADGCQWEHIEVQVMPSNTSGGFAPASRSDCLSEVSSASRYNLHLDALSYYAPPSSQVATITVSANVAAGSQSIPFTLTSGTVSGYDPRALLIYGSSALMQRIDGGAPVDSISGSTLMLPEGTTGSLAAGTVLTINVLLYPPALIAPQPTSTSFVSNPSVQAWLGYIKAVENYMYTSGVTGAVELMNEPEQPTELWDFPVAFYTTPPANFNVGGTGRALAVASSTLPPVPGVKLLNGWTDISGDQSLFNKSTLSNLPVTASVLAKTFLGESMHPYGNNPEQAAWLPSVVSADALIGNENLETETPIGGQVGAGFKLIPFYNQAPIAGGGIYTSISETGLPILSGVTETQQARFDVRQFLTYAGLGVYPIIFYKAGNDSIYEWFGEDAAHTPHSVVASFTGLLADINKISSSASVNLTTAATPKVTSYTGYYPLATVSLVGTKSGNATNSVLFFTWQKTFTVPPGGGNSENYGQNGNGIAPMASWTTLASPAAVPVTISIPTGYSVAAVKDVVTQTAVAYQTSGSSVTYSVADNPVEVLLSPGTASAPTPAAQSISFSPLPATVTYGSVPLVVQATATSGLPVSFSVSGPATLNGSQLSITGKGTVVVTATQGGNASYSAASPVTQTVTVNPAPLTVAVVGAYVRYYAQPNPAFTYTIGPFVNGDTQATATTGTPSLTTTAGADSPAGLYPVVISAGTLTAPNYALTFVNGDLTVLGGVAQAISFPALSNFVTGTSVPMVAIASSGLPVTFTVTSGPATISNDTTLNILGTGQITVTATQAGDNNFNAATSVSRSFTAH